MVYKKFNLQIIFRVCALTATVFFVFVAFQIKFLLAPVIFLLLLVFQVFYLIRFVNRTNRDLTNFLESIRYGEFSRSFRPEGIGASFDKLSEAFNNVIKDFQKVRAEKEEHFHYLQGIVQNIDISIIAYTSDGNIELINKSAKKLFQISTIKNIHEFQSLSPELVQTLIEIRPDKNYLVKVQLEDDILQLAINANELRIMDKLIIISSISNIQNVLDEQETEAWQKLIRVLTHEIMNSITPIASLSSTIELMLKDLNDKAINSGEAHIKVESIDEIHQALQTINKRSTGLLHFVNTYRNLTRIPKPNFKLTRVIDLMNNVSLLFEEEIKSANIRLSFSVEPEKIEIYADEQLIEQVIINLVKNSMHAINEKTDGAIHLKAFYNKRGEVTIQVIDNGTGILKDVIDKIFIPFFTTKPSGSGIGLSLSKQILRLHNASIKVHSVPDKETIFTITF
jgi:two-component system, NtrC family, nitrogen regulation sensor histidine kinase NtrY